MTEIKPKLIEEEMKESYLDYSMSVIVSRALPDVRDGLKPVHRRILYVMNELGLTHNKPFKKSANVVGTCLARYHPHGDIAVYDSMVRMAQDFSLRYVLVDGQGNMGCFTGDTKIKLLDGTSKSFKELCFLYKQEEIFYVYSVDKNGGVVIGEAKNPRLTKKNTPLLELTLDTGEKIRCTPDHKFLLKNLKYKKAKDLTPEDSLMPGYFKLSPIKGNTQLNNYLMIKGNNEKYIFVHDIVDNYNLEKGVYKITDGPVRHHINFNKFDNQPNNIKRISWGDHTKIHNKHIKTLWESEEFRKKQSERIRLFFKNNPEHIEKIRQILRVRNKDKKFIERNSKKLKKVWQNQDLRKKLSDKLKIHFDEHPEKRAKVSKFSKQMWSNNKMREHIINRMKEVMGSDIMKEKLSKIQKERIINHPEIKEQVSKRFKELYKNNPELKKIISERSKTLWKDDIYRSKLVNKEYNHFSAMAKKAWQDENYKKLQVEKTKNLWKDEKFKEKIILSVKKRNLKRLEENPDFMKKLAKKAALVHKFNWKKTEYKDNIIKNKILFYVNRLIKIIGEQNIDEHTYNYYRLNNCFPRFDNAIKYFKNINEMVSLAKEYNHCVINVKFLDYTEDVYDITVKGYHNFLLDCCVFVHNSVDGDSPAAQRYTEARLSKLGEETLVDIEKETVDFVPNYDGSLKEPLVLPSKIPNLLINGSSGIAVGMATNIPPHNFTEVSEGVIALIDNPAISILDLMQIIKGPDFPTAGIICGSHGIKEAYKTGRGKIIVRAKADVSEKRIIITEIPYQVNKSLLIENIADLVRDKKVEGVSNIRDESSREGMRIVVDIKHGHNSEVVLNQLYKHSSLQTTFGIIMLALKDNLPKIFNLKDLIESFVQHRKDVVTRRTAFDLRKAEERAHILEGLRIALSNIDEVVVLLKKSIDVEKARNGLMNIYKLTKLQADAILDMKLSKLISLEQEKINREYDELLVLISKLRTILNSEKMILDIIKEELIELKNKYGDKRKSAIIEDYGGLEEEELIEEEDVILTLTHQGYIKRMSLDLYKQQKRGGKGVISAVTKEEDFIEKLFVVNTHDTLLFFTNNGRVHWLSAYNVPEGTRYSKGSNVVNILNLKKGEYVNTIIPIKNFEGYLFMATRKGIVKKTNLNEFSVPRKGGVMAINLKEGDRLVNVVLTDGNQDILIATRNGLAVRFNERDVSVIGRSGIGVRGIRLKKDDYVVGMEVCDGEYVLTITEDGYGKRTRLDEYSVIKRGGSGVRNLNVKKGGLVAGAKLVNDKDEVMFISKKGIMIRVNVNNISTVGRNAKGVRLIRLNEGDKVIGIAKIAVEEIKDFTLGGY